MAEASAPASSANLGPGFDCVALALELRCSVKAEASRRWAVRHLGPERPDPRSADAVLNAAVAAVGKDRPHELTVTNDIPLARGLGSSAAAHAAGTLAARRAVGEEPQLREVFDLVASLEGHPDNAAAVVFGGLMAVTAAGEPVRLELHERLRPVLGVPGWPLSTRRARAFLAPLVPREVAVRTVQRAVSLVEGLRTGNPALLQAAGGDELHEGPRADLNPLASRLVKTAREAGALHACWSGAGPSILALVTDDRSDEVVRAMAETLGEQGTVLTPEVARTGVA